MVQARRCTAVCRGADQGGAGGGWLQEGEDGYALTGPVLPLAIPATFQTRCGHGWIGSARVRRWRNWGRPWGGPLTNCSRRGAPGRVGAVARPGRARTGRGALAAGGAPHATYTFKHALLQEAAYQSLLKSTRQQYHQRIAQVLTERFPRRSQRRSRELLAQHYTQAGLAEEAVGYWQRRGNGAMRSPPIQKRWRICATGLKVLQTLPDTPNAGPAGAEPPAHTYCRHCGVIKGFPRPRELRQESPAFRELCLQ